MAHYIDARTSTGVCRGKSRRHLCPVADIRKLVQQASEGRTLGILGEPRVNVLKLNLLLDAALVND